MPVTTRSQAKKQQELTANVESTANVEPTANVESTASAKTKKVKNTFDYLYKDENTGIEYISKSQFKKRYESDIRPNLEDIERMLFRLPKKLRAYQELDEILPTYLENVPEHIQKKKDVYVIPPKGLAWKELNRYTPTSYFHLDDYWVLEKIPIRKRRC
jgi:hypothetical protein